MNFFFNSPFLLLMQADILIYKMNYSVFNQYKGKFHSGTGTSHDAAQD